MREHKNTVVRCQQEGGDMGELLLRKGTLGYREGPRGIYLDTAGDCWSGPREECEAESTTTQGASKTSECGGERRKKERK